MHPDTTTTTIEPTVEPTHPEEVLDAVAKRIVARASIKRGDHDDHSGVDEGLAHLLAAYCTGVAVLDR